MADDRVEADWGLNFIFAYFSYWIGAWIQGPWVGFGYVSHDYFWVDFNFWYALVGEPTIWLDVMKSLDLLPPKAKAWATNFN